MARRVSRRALDVGLRRALALAGFLALLCAFAPSALAASSGAISGKVMNASTHKPIEGLEVCAYELGGPEGGEVTEGEPAGSTGCATTNSTGEYTISELANGKFGVVFGSLFGGTPGSATPPNYVLQYYNGKSPQSEPTPIEVGAGTTKEIDAELQEGGEISGTITNSSGAPVEGVYACALRVSGSTAIEAVACGRSGANGEYTIVGLPDASFDIGFISAAYATEYYPGKPSPTEASSVSIVAAKEVKTGINATLQPRPPATVGGEAPPSPVGSTPGVGRPGAGLSNPLSSVPKLAVSLATPRLGVRHGGEALVKLECASVAACHGVLTLTAKRTVKHDGKSKAITVKIATASYSLRHGATATVELKVGPYGRGLLVSAHGQLGARLVIFQLAPKPSRTEVKGVVLVDK
jgi:hypothetical protein